MKPFASALAACLQESTDELVRDAVAVMKIDQKQGERAYSEGEMRQLVLGFVAMVLEAAEERPPQAYTVFMETVMPSMVKAGSSPEALLNRASSFTVQMGMLLAKKLPPAVNEEASHWFCDRAGRILSGMGASVFGAARAA